LQQRVPHTKWVVLRWPTPSMAQQAEMSTEGFEQFYFDVCTLDYGKMAAAMEPLKDWMERTDRVHIVGPGTDLHFSIKGLPAIPCSGEHNIPDGECFTAPVRESVEGKITFNTATLYHGTVFTDVSLVFERGRIVQATANHAEKLNEILDTDEGARYIGEFSLGLNPYITRTMKDILFDEKIAGSFHLTPGNAYDLCDNGNRSEVHWDMVMIQTPAYGGGEIWFDDTLIRKDGRFVPESLQALNPERLA
ncbi:MAG: aminopeptidase, partial [Nitrospinota bacterium]